MNNTMRVISHRGNIKGPGSQCEREHVEEALAAGYEVEVDIWDNAGVLWVGHDKPLYVLPFEWLEKELINRFWFHAKVRSALAILCNVRAQVFFHVDEPRAIVFPQGRIWLHPNENLYISLADLTNTIILDVDGHCRPQHTVTALGVCTDWPNTW